MTKNRIILDPVHGLVETEDYLRRIVDTREVQRLRWIRQTGLASLVFPGADHSRFTHSLGAAAIASRVHSELLSSHGYLGSRHELSPDFFRPGLHRVFVVAALCHDLGHTAFSHALERVLLPEHNGEFISSHEYCTWLLLEDKSTEINDVLRSIDVDSEEVVQLLKRKHFVKALAALVSGDFDVDRWDYLLRDSHYTGLNYGLYDLDWLIHNLSIRKDGEGRPNVLLDVTRCDEALRQFLSARSAMYSQAYWHRTVRGAETLLRAVFECARDPRRTRFTLDPNDIAPGLRWIADRNRQHPNLEEFLETDDIAVISTIRSWSQNATDPILKHLSRCLVQRRLPKLKTPLPDEKVNDTILRLRDKVSQTLKAPRSQAPVLGLTDISEDDIDYFVFRDEVGSPKRPRFNDVFFEHGATTPCTFDELVKLEKFRFPMEGDIPHQVRFYVVQPADSNL